MVWSVMSYTHLNMVLPPWLQGAAIVKAILCLWSGGGGACVFHLQLSHILLLPCTSWSCIRSQIIHLSSKFISCPQLSGSDAFLPLPGSFNDRGMCPGFPRKTQILLPSTYPGLATAFPAYAITCWASLYAFTCLAVITHQRYVPGPD